MPSLDYRPLLVGGREGRRRSLITAQVAGCVFALRISGRDQRPVAQIVHGLRRNGVEEFAFAPVGGVEHRRPAGFNNMLRAAHGRSRIYRYHLGR